VNVKRLQPFFAAHFSWLSSCFERNPARWLREAPLRSFPPAPQGILSTRNARPASVRCLPSLHKNPESWFGYRTGEGFRSFQRPRLSPFCSTRRLSKLALAKYFLLGLCQNRRSCTWFWAQIIAMILRCGHPCANLIAGHPQATRIEVGFNMPASTDPDGVDEPQQQTSEPAIQRAYTPNQDLSASQQRTYPVAHVNSAARFGNGAAERFSRAQPEKQQ
jgi:hypothetical protein